MFEPTLIIAGAALVGLTIVAAALLRALAPLPLADAGLLRRWSGIARIDAGRDWLCGDRPRGRFQLAGQLVYQLTRGCRIKRSVLSADRTMERRDLTPRRFGHSQASDNQYHREIPNLQRAVHRAISP